MSPYLIVVCHFAGDWLLQSPKMAANKGSSLAVLAAHLCLLSLPFALLLPIGMWWIVAVNAVTHGLIDWYIYKPYRLWATKRHGLSDPAAAERFRASNSHANDRFFWATIAVDQCLHLCVAFALFGGFND